MTNQKQLHIFYCYAREDKAFRDALDRHLAGFKRHHLLATWSDREIRPGDDWKATIDTHLREAHIILCLISPDFLASDYCYAQEMQQALERHKQGTARVLPILVRPTYWQNTPISELQMLPSDALAVTLWLDPDAAWVDVVKGIAPIIQEISLSLSIKEEGKALSDPQNNKRATKLETSESRNDDHILSSKAELICPTCKYPLATGEKFCLNCGALLPQSALPSSVLSYPSSSDPFKKKPSLLRPWSLLFSQTQKGSTNRSEQIDNQEASRSSDGMNKAYGFLREKIARELRYGGAVIVCSADERTGQSVHLLSETNWIRLSASMPEIRETSGYTDHRFIKKYEVRGYIIAAAIFEGLYSGGYMIWMDIHKPVLVSITENTVLVVELS